MTSLNTKLQSAKENIAEGNIDEALVVLKELLNEDPSNQEILSTLSELYISLKNWNEALKHTTSLIQLHPQFSKAYFWLGDIFFNLHRYSDALASFSRFIRSDPANDTALSKMGDILAHMKEYQKALKFYEQAAQLNQNEVLNFLKQAEILIELRQFEDAKIKLQQVLKIKPDHSKSLNLLGNLALAAKDFKQAHRFYSDILRNDPTYTDAQINLGLLEFMEDSGPGETASTLFLGLPKGENFGWGICSRYLTQELKKKTSIYSLAYQNWNHNKNKQLPGPYFFALQDINLTTPYPAKGSFNCGYTFFENELTPLSVEFARQYDMVLAGSTWCVDRLNEKGILNTGLLIQGIDPELFYPITESKDEEEFVLFSGGKFELRKGQDLVLKAVKILQDKYPDIRLINIWFNFWPASMATMNRSAHIQYEYKGRNWIDRMEHLYRLNGLDLTRITTHDVYPNTKLRALYQQTDLGIFPNRCEGGTNLVLMEYMACGKPVVASAATGHTDVVNTGNALLLKEFKDLEIYDQQGKRTALWADPSLDELVAQIEYAYHHRDTIKNLGIQAGRDYTHFTWEKSAEQLLKSIQF